jgi:hypothetical protein
LLLVSLGLTEIRSIKRLPLYQGQFHTIPIHRWLCHAKTNPQTKCVNTKVAGIVSGNHVPVDSFRESMDLYCIVTTNTDSRKVRFIPYDTNPGFVLYHGSQIRTWKDSFCIIHHKSSQFSKIRPVFMNPTNPHESSQILSTIAQNESLKLRIRKSRILTNPFKSRFADS